MKILTGVLLSTLLLSATPAMADRGFDHHRDYRHHWKHDRHARHFDRHGPRHTVVRKEVHHYYDSYRPEPAYYVAPTGIQIILPNIFIPIR